jgi:hypothetical protein
VRHYTRVGAVAAHNDVRHPECLRFCPACVAEERNKTGEAYWHRLHQVTGVLVCPTHGLFLESSSIPLRALHHLHAAEDLLSIGVQRKTNSNNAEHKVLLKLAQDVAWLLKNWIPGNDVAWLHERYWLLATKLGFVSPSGCILWKNVFREIQQRYSAEVLELLQCVIPERAFQFRAFWLSNLLRGVESAQPAIRHLLLMDLLKVEVKEFFGLTRHSAIIETQPHECDNPVCPKQGQPVARVQHSYDRRKKVPMLLMTCPQCGQKSYRFTIGDRERKRIKEYGPVWDSELSRLWADQKLSLRSVARKLGVLAGQVGKEAMRLGLPFPRIGRGYVVYTRKLPGSVIRLNHLGEERIKRRSKWLELRESHPSVSTSQLQRLGPTYGWLYAHDRVWLQANCPPRIRPPSPWRRKLADDPTTQQTQSLQEQQVL